MFFYRFDSTQAQLMLDGKEKGLLMKPYEFLDYIFELETGSDAM
jgi:hypothetical protein